MSQYDGETSEEIDGFKYKVLMLDPLTAADIIADLGYILAPVAGPLGGVFAKEKGDILENLMEGELNNDGETQIDVAIEKAVIGFFDRVTKAKQRELMGLLSKVSFVVMPDGSEPELPKIFSTHFRGRIKSMYLWFAFAMKVQFKDFFSGQGDAMNRALAAVAKARKG